MRIRLSLLVAAFFLVPSQASAEVTRIPLVEGLVEVSATRGPSGDREHILTVTRADSSIVEFTVIFREMGANGPITDTRTREVRREDLAKSNRRNGHFQAGDPAKFPGSTLNQLSASTLAELKATGRSAVILGTVGKGDAEAESGFVAIPAGRKYFRGTLARVERGVVPMSVLVNGQPTRLDTIHVKGTLTVGNDSVDIEMWVLDDPLNPMILRHRHRSTVSQTIRFDFPVGEPLAIQLQFALAGGPGLIGGFGGGSGASGGGNAGGTCRASLSGIYFDFAQATLLPQSAGTLKSVADVMTANPGWSLRIEGHTDNVGGGAFNLALSQRRAAAVRDALIAQYKVPAARLAATGFGLTRPVASNDSLAGRAANRRVELSRTCP